MPSIFTLDGARVDTVGWPIHNSGGTTSGRRAGGGNVPTIFGPIAFPNPPTKAWGLGSAVATGLGELTDRTKTGLVAVAALSVISIVAWSGLRAGGRRRKRRR